MNIRTWLAAWWRRHIVDDTKNLWSGYDDSQDHRYRPNKREKQQ